MFQPFLGSLQHFLELAQTIHQILPKLSHISILFLVATLPNKGIFLLKVTGIRFLPIIGTVLTFLHGGIFSIVGVDCVGGFGGLQGIGGFVGEEEVELDLGVVYGFG